MRFILIYVLVFSFGIAIAQNDEQSHPPTVIMNTTVHTGNGEVYENAIVAFIDGKITLVADSRLIRFNPEGYRVIDGSGQHVYPGLIAMNSQLGIKEIELVRATHDMREVGSYNPEIRSIIAYNTDSRVIPTVRSNGILMAQIVPDGGIISGTSSVVHLYAWNWEDAAMAMDNGLHLDWPSPYSFKWDDGVKWVPNENYEEQVRELRQLFDEAIAYNGSEHTYDPNLKLQAMRGLFTGELTLYVETDHAKSILHAAAFANEYGIRMVVVGGAEAHLVKEELAERGIPVVLTATHKLPARDDDPVDLPFRMPQILTEAGVLCAVSVSSDGSSYWNMRNLPFQVGTAAAYGLDKEVALQLVTKNPAMIMGLDEHSGWLDEGRDATLIVCSGDIFDMKESKVSYAFIQGMEVEIENWQEELYQTFSRKYGLEE